MALLILGAVRSPVLSVAIAFFAGKIARREITTTMLMRYALYGLVLAIAVEPCPTSVAIWSRDGGGSLYRPFRVY